jgi:uncharacterized protein YbgA (DUF1722 family)
MPFFAGQTHLRITIFTVKKMHLREKAVWYKAGSGLFLEPPFWVLKHHFKRKKRDYF